MLLLSSFGDKVGSKGLAQLSERVNRSRLQTGVPISGHPLQSGGKDSAQDSIRGFLKEHDYSKAVDMIGGVCGSIIAPQLRNLEVW